MKRHTGFQKGEKVKHETFGEGTYSHQYAQDACIVAFDEKYEDGFQTRVIIYKDIEKL